MGFKRPRRRIDQRSCILLACRYKEGFARGEWTTQADASRVLGVSQAELSMALRWNSLPVELLAMFAEAVEIRAHTVRVIRDAIARDGLETVRERLRQHVAASRKLPAKTVLAIVKGRISEASKALRAPGMEEKKRATLPRDLPMYILNRYRLGIINGEWTSYSGCCRALGISRRNISDAVAIGQLPDGVRCLFKEADLTFSVGRKLLAIERIVGTKTLQARAHNISYLAREHTAEHVLRELNTDDPWPEKFSRIRIKKGRGVGRLIIECDHADRLFLYRREMESALNKVVNKLAMSPSQEKIMRTTADPYMEELRQLLDRNR
ncbi:hypothetical protein SAMN05192539_103158 [Paraburkholderia diazotrophica]|uniref:Uncharacterized protein n=2 Tax=Paraburkholderia diazotrophica TaxID=667676 RepID=A0A1H7DVN6_9BURK|nr:hypothetical protein SAMN05192539_103158 [Paraburkholderia diazotrophica]